MSVSDAVVCVGVCVEVQVCFVCQVLCDVAWCGVVAVVVCLLCVLVCELYLMCCMVCLCCEVCAVLVCALPGRLWLCVVCVQ